MHAATTAAEEAAEGSTGITIVVLPEVAMVVAFVVLFAVGVCIARKRHKVHMCHGQCVCEWRWGVGEIVGYQGSSWEMAQSCKDFSRKCHSCVYTLFPLLATHLDWYSCLSVSVETGYNCRRVYKTVQFSIVLTLNSTVCAPPVA